MSIYGVNFKSNNLVFTKNDLNQIQRKSNKNLVRNTLTNLNKQLTNNDDVSGAWGMKINIIRITQALGENKKGRNNKFRPTL